MDVAREGPTAAGQQSAWRGSTCHRGRRGTLPRALELDAPLCVSAGVAQSRAARDHARCGRTSRVLCAASTRGTPRPPPRHTTWTLQRPATYAETCSWSTFVTGTSFANP